jgi:cyclic beta-1,2-glucan synthetase
LITGEKLTDFYREIKTQFRSSDLVARVLADSEAPLRAELFSADQMEQHGRNLAAKHQLARGRVPDQLLTRLARNESALVGVCNLLTEAVNSDLPITPAGEWLLDNFYLIEEQIRTAKRHLPRGYSRQLPRLEMLAAESSDSANASAGRPRVYDLAIEIISHGDGRIDSEVLCRFIAAYQSVTALNLGELWATPIMLRLAAIENLRRVAVRLAIGRVDRNLANDWADKMMETAESDPTNLILVIADMARSNPPMVSAFVAELARRLQGRGPALVLLLNWIEQRLSETGMTIEQLVQLESQQQAADQVSVSNSIGSLRLLGAIDWRKFVESMSLVEKTLREDPDGVYGRMDFATRDRYRHATERIARTTRLSEGEVARQAVELAQAAAALDLRAGDGLAGRLSHVGYYLVDQGLPELERRAGIRLTSGAQLRRTAARWPLLLYLGPILLITAIITMALLAQADLSRVLDWAAAAMPVELSARLSAGLSCALLTVLGAIALLAASQLAVALVNWLATLLVKPRALPGMDFSEGIPASSRTLVVVPTMLSSASGVEKLIESLEVRFLANRDPCLHFGLLTDFVDAHQESLPEDDALLCLARTRIDELNAKYGTGSDRSADQLFFLFHRSRQWNAAEKIWMGYERKRGKLAALNALLRSAAPAGESDFSLVVGNTTILSSVKYVITLDTDTQLPRDSARQFIGAMAHPLNKPVFDQEKHRVVAGYGILQPRVAISLPGSNRSRYARLYGGEPGIDPYTRAVSDVYQDIFGEGSFIGKGIYDVDAFEQSVGGCFPDNLILSHDLLEGCYARAGLLSNATLYEDYPARYSADVSRRYRWIRGDWQLAGWLLRKVPGKAIGQAAGQESGDKAPLDASGTRRKNPLSTLSQWKFFDNLRRSLVPTALTALLVSGWTLLASPWLWTLSVIGIVLIPSLCALLLEMLRKSDEVVLRQHFAALAQSASRRFGQLAFELACLPYEAFFSLDAILRTIWRMRIARRPLLQWNPSTEADHDASRKSARHDDGGMGELLASCRTMWFGPAIALALFLHLARATPAVLLIAGPFLVLWLASPLIACWISRPLVRCKAALSDQQLVFLHRLTRRIWAFFEDFVGENDHWLPPDNYQEYRVAAIAHRTSPTNIGMALLANLAAYDFGYITTGQLARRTANTLHTMGELARHRGHFYNWYDTQTLQPLLPLYVSTVDSGNLAGHLLTLRAGLLALADDRILPARLFGGLDDTLRVLAQLLEDGADKASRASLEAFRSALQAASRTPPLTLAAAHLTLAQLLGAASGLLARLEGRAEPSAEPMAVTIDAAQRDGRDAQAAATPARKWAQSLVRQCQDVLDELAFLAPLNAVQTSPGAADEFFDSSAMANIPTLRELAAAGSLRARDRMATIEGLAWQAGEFAQMDYDFLYDRTRHLLTIGYNVGERRLDLGYYDLLASEARLSCFVAIAQGKLPQDIWFALGRLLTSTTGEPVLLSWSGSMFEYLMPLLVMPTYDNTLLDQTCKAAVARQIEYGKQRGVPWGISESGYNTVDAELNYQYRAFGVPGLGLKRGLGEDLVVAPYASVMALMVAPEAACRNLQRLAEDGLMGQFGFFEAIDYTPTRQRRKESNAVVRSFMAHHQGMSLLALDYLLMDRPMQRRFASERLFQSVMPLLQERIPKACALFTHTATRSEIRTSPVANEMPIRVFKRADTPTPQVQLLSNGRYHVMLSNAGGGYSRWKDLAVTRWREDGTCDNWGSFCYIRELSQLSRNGSAGAAGEFWSTAYQPTLKRPASYEAIFSEGRAEFRRRDAVAEGSDNDYFETHTEIVVSPEDDIELRRVRITNRSRQRREIEMTSYAEVVIAPPVADAIHPAFSKLFVHTEILRERRAILCTRRPRSPSEQTPWMLHLVAVHGAPIGAVSYETDRARFIGRGRTAIDPLAMNDWQELSGSEGSVLDPIVAIRHRLTIAADQTITVDIVTGMAETRDGAVLLVDKYQDRHLAERVLDLAWTHSQVVLRQLNASEADAQLYARLASSIIYANADLRAESSVLIRNRRGQSGLWGYAISGDLPIVLLQIGDSANIALVRQLVQAHAYWRLKGLVVDLVIWNEDHDGYRQQLQDQIIGLITSGIDASVIDRSGGIFVRSAEQISAEDRLLFRSVARAVITDSQGTMEEQLEDRRLAEPLPTRLMPIRALRSDDADAGKLALPGKDLILFNGLGGFTADGSEYVITLAAGQVTPSPWVNVLANPNFGTVISESGVAYTWSENAHDSRRARKWRAVHPRGDLGDDGFCRTRRTRARLGAVQDDQPGQPCAERRIIDDLQSRALRCCRRCLCRHAAHRARRMELVYRLGGLDVPPGRRVLAGLEAGGGNLAPRAVFARQLAGVQDPLPLSRNDLSPGRRANVKRGRGRGGDQRERRRRRSGRPDDSSGR